MEIKVKSVEVDERSLAERERDITGEKVAEDVVKVKIGGEKPAEEKPKEEEKPGEKPSGEEAPKIELTDESVLDYIKNKHNKEFKSLDEVFTPKVVEPELPEDVKTLLDFKKETNRGIEDFVRYQQDIDSLDEDQKLREYYKSIHSGLDDNDISVMIEEFKYDEEVDDERDINKKKLNKKLEIEKASQHLNQLKEKYKAPLESKEPKFQETDEYKTYLQSIKEAEERKAEDDKRRNLFAEKTDGLFNNDFKGFEVPVDKDKKFVYNPGKPEEVKKAQSSPLNLIGKFLDEKGYIKDVEGYHLAMAAAMNPSEFAKFFYEQGKADIIEEEAKKSKNIDFSRQKPRGVKKDRAGVTAVTSKSSKGLKIKAPGWSKNS